MKLDQEKFDGENAEVNVITAYTVDYIAIKQQHYTQSIIVQAKGNVHPWPISHFEEIKICDFDYLKPFDWEVILLGTGKQHRFFPPAMLRSLRMQKMNIETMDSGAACRTYNILLSERRRVAAAIIFGEPFI